SSRGAPTDRSADPLPPLPGAMALRQPTVSECGLRGSEGAGPARPKCPGARTGENGIFPRKPPSDVRLSKVRHPREWPGVAVGSGPVERDSPRRTYNGPAGPPPGTGPCGGEGPPPCIGQPRTGPGGFPVIFPDEGWFRQVYLGRFGDLA